MDLKNTLLCMKTAMLCIVCLVLGYFFIYPYHWIFRTKSAENTEEVKKETVNDVIKDKPAVNPSDNNPDIPAPKLVKTKDEAKNDFLKTNNPTEKITETPANKVVTPVAPVQPVQSVTPVTTTKTENITPPNQELIKPPTVEISTPGKKSVTPKQSETNSNDKPTYQSVLDKLDGKKK